MVQSLRMCGRFTQTRSREEVLEELGGIELPPLFTRRYNIAPTQKVAILRQDHSERAVESTWGFKHPATGQSIINARCETLTERTMFRDLLKDQRCLIPADGFYEWADKQPYYFQLKNRRIFGFAGLWWNNRCVIITRAADAHMRGIHARMPVILPFVRWEEWLSNTSSIPSAMFELDHALSSHPVSRHVNSVSHDDSICLAPAEVQIDLSLFPDDD